jgi:hypothetical protein
LVKTLDESKVMQKTSNVTLDAKSSNDLFEEKHGKKWCCAVKKKDIDEKIKRWFRLTLFFGEEFYIFFTTLMLFYITQLFFFVRV